MKGNAKTNRMTRGRALAYGAAAVLAVIAAIVVVSHLDREDPVLELRELTRDKLDLSDDGILFVKGSAQPFHGTLVEFYPDMTKKIALEIRSGRAHGTSRGWYENGQLEVDEHFVNGISNGTRTRWYENGAKKSEAQIVSGVMVGKFVRWYQNGNKSAEATMVDGKPDGVCEAWHPSGARKSRVVLEAGEVVSRETFEEEGEL